MDTRKLATAVTRYANSVAEAGEALAADVEKLMSADGDEGKDESSSSGGKSSRSSARSERSSRADKDDDDKDDEPSEEDIAKAARAALKVLDSAEVKKVIKKHGKADRATEVEPKYRKATIAALEEAVENVD